MSTGLTLGLAAGLDRGTELEDRASGRCEWDSVTGESRCPFFNEGRGVATTVRLTSTAGLAAGYAVGALVQPSVANYGFVNATGLYGSLGVMTLGVLDANEGYGLGWLLGQGVDGLGAVMATQLKPTESQTWWMSLGVLGGGLLGFGVAVLLGGESTDALQRWPSPRRAWWVAASAATCSATTATRRVGPAAAAIGLRRPRGHARRRRRHHRPQLPQPAVRHRGAGASQRGAPATPRRRGPQRGVDADRAMTWSRGPWRYAASHL